MPGPRIAVVVVGRQHGALAATAIDAALASGGIKVNILLVGTAGERAWLAEKYPNSSSAVDLVVYEPDSGFGAAANAGINHAMGSDAEFVAVIDPRLRLEPGALARMSPVAARRGIACPRILRPDDRLHSTGGTLDFWRARRLNRDENAPDHGQNNVPTEVDFAPREAMLFSRAALDTGIRFHEPYFDTHEDADLCLALGAHGFTAGYVPEARALFLRGGSRSADAYYATRNRIALVDRWGAVGQKLAARVYLFFIIPPKIFMLRAGGRRAEAQAMWRGWGDGLRRRLGPRAGGAGRTA